MNGSVDRHADRHDYYSRITVWMLVRRNEYGEFHLTTRAIGEAMGLTIYQARAYLNVLYNEGVVDRPPPGRGRAVLWYVT